MTVALIETEPAIDYALADQIVPVGEAPDDRAALQFINNLRIASRIISIDKVVDGYATDSLRDAIAVTVVDVAHTAPVQISYVVLEIVDIAVSVSRNGVAVVVVVVAGQARFPGSI